jgi:hypothetical protein
VIACVPKRGGNIVCSTRNAAGSRVRLIRDGRTVAAGKFDRRGKVTLHVSGSPRGSYTAVVDHRRSRVRVG